MHIQCSLSVTPHCFCCVFIFFCCIPISTSPLLIINDSVTIAVYRGPSPGLWPYGHRICYCNTASQLHNYLKLTVIYLFFLSQSNFNFISIKSKNWICFAIFFSMVQSRLSFCFINPDYSTFYDITASFCLSRY